MAVWLTSFGSDSLVLLEVQRWHPANRFEPIPEMAGARAVPPLPPKFQELAATPRAPRAVSLPQVWLAWSGLSSNPTTSS